MRFLTFSLPTGETVGISEEAIFEDYLDSVADERVEFERAKGYDDGLLLDWGGAMDWEELSSKMQRVEFLPGTEIIAKRRGTNWIAFGECRPYTADPAEHDLGSITSLPVQSFYPSKIIDRNQVIDLLLLLNQAKKDIQAVHLSIRDESPASGQRALDAYGNLERVVNALTSTIEEE